MRWHLPTCIVDFLRVCVAFEFSWYFCLGTLWDSLLLGDSLNLDVGFDFWVCYPIWDLRLSPQCGRSGPFWVTTRSRGSAFSCTIEIQWFDAMAGVPYSVHSFHSILVYCDGWLYLLYCIWFCESYEMLQSIFIFYILSYKQGILTSQLYGYPGSLLILYPLMTFRGTNILLIHFKTI